MALEAFKVAAFLVALIALLAHPSSGVATASSRIVGGSNAVHSQFPYQVSVRRNGFHACGGAIISQNYILTAAQCVVKSFASGVVTYPSADFTVRSGSLSLYSGGMLVDVSDIIVHSDYGQMLNDLALLRLHNRLIYSDNIQSVRLAYDKVPLSSAVTISGWGLTKSGGDVPRNLQWSSMNVIAVENCSSWVFGEEAAMSLLCLQHDEGRGICNGDIGGPAVYSGELVGIATFTLDRCGSEHPDAFAKVSNYVNWIREHSDVAN